ncbi:MAG: methyltransferase domain-containing protein, partial [Planctomycetota bacterium]
LIVGAGSGNDVAGALRRGAERITAVEIDPAIVDMGRRLHPERPYASSKVRVVEDDARSYFATADAKFDLIIFGLLDSHTTTAMTNARLDHYVYTRESLARAKSLLKEGGVMVLSFEASKPFIADRMSRCLGEVFGQPPLAFRIPLNPMGWGGVLFVAGDSDAIENQLTEHPRLARQIEKWQADHPLQLAGTTSVTTDDWPYIYLERASIPSLYVLLAALMLGLVAYGKRRLQTPWTLSRWKAPQWHFFFLGAAFLLLEVQNISKASVVLGNTWVVNAVIVSGILTMILLANFVAAKGPKLPPSVVAVGLLGSCFGLYLFDLSSLAFLPFTSKAVLVGVLTTLPMFFSGILFVDSFAKVRDKDLALGANLFGALVGGMLQTITFVIGVKALLLVVAGLYAAALLLKPKRSGDETASGANRNATDTPTLADDAPQNESQPELATV